MKTVWPEYFERFHCIADRCVHSCCEGWEIDIDDNTAELYSCEQGAFGDELRAVMEKDEEGTTHFILNEDEKCPFLQKNGLCRLILTMGEENLCDICREHPRFYNYYNNVEESGIGMCCEEAVRLLTEQERPVRYIIGDDHEGPDEIFQDPLIIKQKKELLSVLRSAHIPFEEKLNMCAQICDCEMPEPALQKLLPVFLQMEIMNAAWEQLLNSLAESGREFYINCIPGDIISENLLEYFVYRHFKSGEHTAAEIFGFCLVSLLTIRSMEMLDSDVKEHIRLYSSEIEYCEDNTETLMNLFRRNQAICADY